MKPKTAKKYGRRYPWLEWFSRQRFSLTRGHEFDCEPAAMAQLVYRAASRLKQSVTVHLQGDRINVGPKEDRRASN